MFLKKIKKNKGFTLIEAMISIGLFTVIMTIGIGAILSVNNTHRKTQSMRAIIDNLGFLMEDMARTMRLGDKYNCLSGGIPTTVSGLEDTNNSFGSFPCPGIAFEPFWEDDGNGNGGYQLGYDDNQIAYYIKNDDNNIGTIFKKRAEDSNLPDDWIAVTTTDINIDIANSGFYIVGAEIMSDGTQPRVIIVLKGTASISNQTTEFNLQTTVSQRALDTVF